jgi:hypothetical protein
MIKEMAGDFNHSGAKSLPFPSTWIGGALAFLAVGLTVLLRKLSGQRKRFAKRLRAL